MNVTVMFVSFFALDLKHVFSGKVADRAAGSSAKDEAAPLCLNSSSKTRLLHVFLNPSLKSTGVIIIPILGGSSNNYNLW